MQPDPQLSFILDAVKQAGNLFLPTYKRTPIAQDAATLLRQLDDIEQRCLTSLQANLAAAFPTTPWHLGDEFDHNGQKQPLDLPEYWLCDAMDGAIQYLQHLPGWTINLVLMRQGQPYVSVIYAPLEQELFWAQAGGGAFLNGTLLTPSAKQDASMMVAVFEYGHQDERHYNSNLNQQVSEGVKKLLDTFGVVRNYGPHGLQLAQVGAGRIDVFYQLGLDTYNWVAGILIAREAGAEVRNAQGAPWHWGDESLLVTAPGLAQKLLQTA